MWWEIEYQPTTLFSLKTSDATNAAGKSLFMPSPYSVKMALLNAVCTFESVKKAEEKFGLIREMEIEFSLPEYIVVNNCFIRIMQESRSETRAENPNLMFKSTVAFREYLFFSGNLRMAFRIANPNDEELAFLKSFFYKINYYGKRSCFFQIVFYSENPIEKLPNNYSRKIIDKDFFLDGKAKLLAKVDDFGPKATFNKVNNYSSEKTDRITEIIGLPYQSIKSNKNFTLFKRSK